MTANTIPTEEYTKRLSGERQRSRGRLLATATSAQASASIMIQGLPALAAFIQAGLGLSAVQTGSLTTAASVASVFFLVVAGRLLDHRSERQVMIVGAGLMAVGAVAAAAVPGYVPLLAFLVLVGVGYSTAQVGGNRTIVETFPATRLGLAVGIRQAGLPAGGAVGAALLPAVADAAGWRVALLVAAGCVLAGAGVFWLVHGGGSPRSGVAQGGAYDSIRDVAALMRRTATERALRRSVILGIALMTAQTAVLVFLIASLAESSGLSLAHGAMLLVVALLAGTVGRVVLTASARTRWATSGGVLTVTALAVTASLAAVAAAPAHLPVAVIVSGAAWTGFFGFGWFGPWVLHLIELAKPHELSQTLGIAMASAQLAIVTVPLGLGVMRDTTGTYTTGWIVLGATTGLATLAWVVSRSWNKTR